MEISVTGELNPACIELQLRCSSCGIVATLGLQRCLYIRIRLTYQMVS
jgi:hypothetical protein